MFDEFKSGTLKAWLNDQCEKCIHKEVCLYREHLDEGVQVTIPYTPLIDVQIKCKKFVLDEPKIKLGKDFNGLRSGVKIFDEDKFNSLFDKATDTINDAVDSVTGAFSSFVGDDKDDKM